MNGESGPAATDPDSRNWTVELWSENVEYRRPTGSRQGRRDGDRVLSSTQLPRQSCDRKGRRTLPGRHSYRLRHPRFSCITAG